MSFSFKIFCSSEARDTFLKANHAEELWINHRNLVHIRVRYDGAKIIISVFDILGVESLTITADPSRSIYKELSKGNEEKLPSILSIEKSLEGEEIIHLYFLSQKNILQLCRIQRHKTDSTNVLKNLFEKNCTILNSVEAPMAHKQMYAKFQVLKFEEQAGQLSEIIEKFGAPHSILKLSSGVQLLCFYGIHQCAKNKTAGILMIKVNRFFQVTGVYKFLTQCDCQTGKTQKICQKSDTDYA